ncbi:MAG: acetate--CoA ligase family protein, partial [Gemmatimonadota bacterium]|nr:acetate--CoA ligase family protein [Gemmatimonadota bacterium]
RGGTDVELYRDVAIRALPADPACIRSACRELALWPRLAGHRGRPAASVDAIVETAAALGRALLETPHFAEIELNPVFVYADRVLAIDASARSVDV